MSSPCPPGAQSAAALDPGALSFSGLYMRLQQLKSFLFEEPDRADASAVEALEAVLADATHARESLAPFMYKLAAECLVTIVDAAPHGQIGARAEAVLRRCSTRITGTACLPAAQALGELPLELDPPAEPSLPAKSSLPKIGRAALLSRLPVNWSCPRQAGRSLLLELPGARRVLVLKTTRTEAGLNGLLREAAWMRRLQAQTQGLADRFDVPEPFPMCGSPIVKLKPDGQGDPLSVLLPADSTNQALLAFTATSDYFVYPNDPRRLRSCSPEELAELITRNSRLLGWLTGRGVVHSAPIPLFHNRTQQTRRDDHGAYLWQRGGRLDRWLWSCLHPNFGLSGLRDFEHLRCLSGARGELFREAGNQILSLALVAGSCFRLQKPDSFGRGPDGRPRDLRHLFDQDLLEALLEGIACGFYRGFVGRPLQRERQPQLKALSRRMIEEMGVDRTMTEVFRVEDQRAMGKQEFIDFLRQRGFSAEEAAGLEKGAQELELATGPHLGGFNQRISLPELIDFTAGTAAAAIAGRFLDERPACRHA